MKSVVSGYAGGTVPRPTYAMVSSGLTGHAEVVQIAYDPAVVSFEKLLETFWECHDPTTLNRQGPDFGTQYRSIILYHDDAQKQAAQESYRALTDAGVFASPIVTQLVPLKAFYLADRHHQDYYRKNRNAAYCRMVHRPQAHEDAGQEGKLPVRLDRQAVTSAGCPARFACSGSSPSPPLQAPRELRRCECSPRRS